MKLTRLVLATANPGKVRELVPLVAEWGPIEVRAFDGGPMPDETGETYEANAVLKARAVATATGEAAVADDSGIEVDALDGRPGVLSARYGPSESARNERLLAELRGVPSARRTARYRAVVALALPDGTVVAGEGTCDGEIALAPRGSAGFGYDPIFVSAELGRTIGESSADEKARVSHRARAMRALGRALQARGFV